VSCSKPAEPIKMLFGLRTRMGPRKRGSHWRHLVNTTKPSRQWCSLLSNHFHHLFVVTWFWSLSNSSWHWIASGPLRNYCLTLVHLQKIPECWQLMCHFPTGWFIF